MKFYETTVLRARFETAVCAAFFSRRLLHPLSNLTLPSHLTLEHLYCIIASIRARRALSSAAVVRRFVVYRSRSHRYPSTICNQKGLDPMPRAHHWIAAAARSNRFSRFPIVGLASCCRIIPTQKPPNFAKTFDLTGSEGSAVRHPKLLYVQLNAPIGLSHPDVSPPLRSDEVLDSQNSG